MTLELIEQLSDDAALRVLQSVATKWFDHQGWQANVVVRQAEKVSGGAELPEWLAQPDADKQAAGEAARKALHTISLGDDTSAQTWVADSLSEEQKGKAHALDPITLGIGGAILIGLVLAARVEKIDNTGVRFFKGLPKELGKILGSVAKAILR